MPGAGSATTTARCATSSGSVPVSLQLHGTSRQPWWTGVAAAGPADLTRNAKVIDLSAAWLIEVEAWVLAQSTKARYAMIVKQFITPGLGQLRLRELSVPAVDRLLRVTVEKHGAATAKGVRSVLSGMVGMAMRHEAMTSNPIRDDAPISVPKKIVKALTPTETELLVKKLRADNDAKRLDLIDLVEFMLGTGARLGEVCALREPQVDLNGGTVEISATATAFGIEERPKTKARWRVIAVPPECRIDPPASDTRSQAAHRRGSLPEPDRAYQGLLQHGR